MREEGEGGPGCAGGGECYAAVALGAEVGEDGFGYLHGAEEVDVEHVGYVGVAGRGLLVVC